ncbi:hypothetical protein HYH02_009120 [Chlamydomonas schloesseri]|uniref:AB hydrolase-1 domain-containing protein n=1 Tax=Chlamydomonas schloesseri TaxID=2026947 RepID=A0A835WB82_9CHLO|nr:hypothetical protein HYH02_009120 [Chlamydomonas schloesseri]|eukprot:KAG2444182.1 hypothetical protein HYH02_009120 [Chlamydomonas schloesseri]
MFTHPSVTAAGFVPGWRLVVLERPGLGLSDEAPPGYTYTQFAADFREFCARMGLRRVAVIGFSAGTPFATAIACTCTSSGGSGRSNPGDAAGAARPGAATAAAAAVGGTDAAAASGCSSAPVDPAAVAVATTDDATAAGMAHGVAGQFTLEAGADEVGPEVVGVALVSAIGPPNTPNKRQGMALLFQFAYWACANFPWLVGAIVRSEAAALRRRPVHAQRESFKPYSGAADVAALKRPEVEAAFLESAMELYSRGQEAAVLRENLMFAAAPWGLDLAACSRGGSGSGSGTPRVAIWQGGQDRGCTVPMAQYLAQQLRGGGAAEKAREGGKGRGSTAAKLAAGAQAAGSSQKQAEDQQGRAPGNEEEAQEAAADEERVQLHVLPDQGHMLYFEVWDRVVAWVDDVMSR